MSAGGFMAAKRVGLNAETILQKAADLADDSGLDALSLATLAAHLGVRTPALYHYFAGLAGLRRELALRGLHEVSARLGRSVMGKAGDDAVLALAHAFRDYAKEHPGLYVAASRAPDPEDPEWRVAGDEAVGIVLCALSAYNLSPEDALHAVRMLRSIVHGIVVLENAGGFGLPLDIDETFRRLLSSFLAYLHGNVASQ
jgi:AcrR family transcriptional regulator